MFLLGTGCEKKTETTTPSSETKLTSISFAANDSFPGLKEAKFTVDFAPDTALVYNPDSLRIGTRIDSVVATFYFSTTIGYATFYSDSDTVLIKANDTLNFMPRPCRLHVVSEDMEHDRYYNIFVNVHKVDPDLYVWTRTKERLFSGNRDVHAETLGGAVLLFTQDGIGAELYASETNGRDWDGPFSLTGLPKTANARNIIASDSLLYYTESNRLYTSSDGANWDSQDCSGLGFDVVNMLFYYNDSVWAVVRDPADGLLWFATMPEGGTLAKQYQIGPVDDYFRTVDDGFPISDFAAVTFLGKSLRKRAMILGGFDINGHALNSRWNLEWVDTDSDEGFYRLENFTIEQPSFKALTGAALVWYDEKILLFGAQLEGSTILNEPVFESKDEGMNWSVPDSAALVMPAEFLPRQRLGITVTDDLAILLIGGQNKTTSFADVWRGKKNSIEWE